MIASYKDTFGKNYGILVLVALIYFSLVAAAWFGMFLYLHQIVYEALGMLTAFIIQLFYRKPAINIVLGALGMFFCIIELLRTLNTHTDLHNPFIYKLFIFTIAALIVGIIMSGILMFSFMYAFKQQEKKGL